MNRVLTSLRTPSARCVLFLADCALVKNQHSNVTGLCQFWFFRYSQEIKKVIIKN